MIYILMGVAGSGKTTVGKLLASQLGFAFFDADDFHPEENIRKMSSGIALNDEDRLPWLKNMKAQFEAWHEKIEWSWHTVPVNG